MKRLLSWLLVLVMVISLLPMSAFATGTDVDLNDGDDFELEFDELTTEPEPEFGTLENPYVITVGDRTNFVGIAVPAGGSVYAVADNATGPYNVVMGTYDAAYNVVYNPKLPGAVWYAEADADGYYQINELMDQPFSYTLQVNNPSDTDLYILAWLTAGDTTGTMGDPAQLVLGENEANIAAGSDGYYYTWTATQDGILSIDMPNGDWTYVINNLTTYKYGDMQWSDSDPVLSTGCVVVNAGDEVQVIVNTYNPADEWNNPAGTISFTATLNQPSTGLTKSSNSLIFNDLVLIKNYAYINDYSFLGKAYIEANGGIIVWTTPVDEADAVMGHADADVNYGLTYGTYGGKIEYSAVTDGVPFAEFTTDRYFRIFVRLPDGSYIYEPLQVYSVQEYCEGRLAKSSDQKMKNACAALLHFGAQAQLYFDVKTDDLANANILTNYPGFDYSDSMIDSLATVNTNITSSSSVKYTGKSGMFLGSMVFKCFATCSFTPVSAELLCWVGDISECTVDNVTYTLDMELSGKEYNAITNGFPPAEYGDTFFVCGKFVDEEGNEHYTTVEAISLEQYALSRIQKSTDPVYVELMKRMVVYGEYAKTYFS